MSFEGGRTRTASFLGNVGLLQPSTKRTLHRGFSVWHGVHEGREVLIESFDGGRVALVPKFPERRVEGLPLRVAGEQTFEVA